MNRKSLVLFPSRISKSSFYSSMNLKREEKGSKTTLGRSRTPTEFRRSEAAKVDENHNGLLSKG